MRASPNVQCRTKAAGGGHCPLARSARKQHPRAGFSGPELMAGSTDGYQAGAAMPRRFRQRRAHWGTWVSAVFFRAHGEGKARAASAWMREGNAAQLAWP